MTASRSQFFYKDVLPFAVIVALECINVGLNTVFKAATNGGMSIYVFVVYSYALVVLLLLPFPFIYRSTVLPLLTTKIIGQEFFCGLIGSVGLLCGYKGIEYASPTLASAMRNLVPAFTFILAIICSMEKLEWRRPSSQAKVLGTTVCIVGALIIILYKGPSIIIFSPQNSSKEDKNFFRSSNSKWIIGGFLLSIEYIIFSVWYIVQAQILKEYPAELTVMFFYNLFATIISGVISFVVEPHKSAWTLKLDISLAAILYSGLYSCLSCCTSAWILRYKGPVYLAMFKPLSITIAASMGIIFLGDTLHVGSIIGAVMITLGFYAVMWGKAKEDAVQDFVSATDIERYIERTPLLKNEDRRC